jgi:hypothetical protein
VYADGPHCGSKYISSKRTCVSSCYLFLFASFLLPIGLKNDANPSAPAQIIDLVLAIRLEGTNLVVYWHGPSSAQLEEAATLTGPWQRIADAQRPHVRVLSTNSVSRFFRSVIPE